MLTASASISGVFKLGTISNDAGGRSAARYGQFSLQQSSAAVTVAWTPFTPSQSWQYAYFGANWNNPAVAGDTADPDGDGMPNLLEYALGKSPVAADRPGLTTAISSGDFLMTYTLAEGATDVVVQPQWSTDLSAWSGQGISTQILSDDGTIQTVRATVPMGANTRVFGRLRVSRP